MAFRVPTIIKAAPMDAPPGGAYAQVLPGPHNVIYDTTASGQVGNLYTNFATVVSVMNQFNGTSYLYIQNGSIIPAGTWTMTQQWYMDIDGYGTTFGPGVFFTHSPISITALHYATIHCNATHNTSTFTMTNSAMSIIGATLILGTNGNFINDSTGIGTLTLDNTTVSTSGQTLIIGG